MTAPIFEAVMAFDVEALRRELAAGVDPDLLDTEHPYLYTALYYAVYFGSAQPEKRIRERLACILVLLEAGASVNKVSNGSTPLYCSAGTGSAAYQPIIVALMKAGADVNFTDRHGRSVLTKAAEHGTAVTVTKLISAGAVDLDRALVKAILNGKMRNCVPLLRAGAAIPNSVTWKNGLGDTFAYLEKIDAAGTFKAYEKEHRQELTAIFLPKFPLLPAEMIGRILEFSFDFGGH